MGIQINDVDPRVQYVPIAAQVVFTIPFEFFEDADIKIYFDDSTTPESSGFTIVGANSNGTKEVTFSVAPETSGVAKLTIERDTQVKRSTNFTDSSDWTPDNINNEYNRVTMMVGEREGEILRSVARPVQSAETYLLNWPDGATADAQFLGVSTSGLALLTVATFGAVVISGNTPVALGAAAPGTSDEVSRYDHVHPEITGADLWDFTTGLSNPAHQEGRVFYDDGDKALAYYNDEADVTMQIGREQWIRTRNSTGSTINDGKAVYISGATGQLPNITLAQADATTTSRVVGVATHDIENNSNGYITTFGVVNDVDTSSWSDGDTLYLDASTAGDLTNTAPTGTELDVIVGTVAHSHATQGKILVRTGQDLIQRASQAEAEAGTDDTKMMTPLRSSQAIAALATSSLTWLTKQATTSGTSVTFSGIPSGVTELVVWFEGVSDSTDSIMSLQIGDSGGIETTGYEGTGWSSNASASKAASQTNGFRCTGSQTHHDYHYYAHGFAHLILVDPVNHTWAFASQTGDSTTGGGNRGHVGAGTKTLSAELTQIKMLISAGTLDAGSMNVGYK
jgi:hypothetical protein